MRKKIGEKTVIESEYIYICDNCEKPLDEKNHIFWDGSWTDGYDYFAQERIEVCSFSCLRDQIADYLKDEFDMLIHGYNDDDIHLTFSVSHFDELCKLLNKE